MAHESWTLRRGSDIGAGGSRRRCALRHSPHVVVAAGVIFLAACGSSGAAPHERAASSTTITLYNGQHQQTTDTLVSAFEHESGIKVSVRNDDEATFDDEIVAEGKRSPADVLLTENSPALEFLQQKGLLAKVDHSTLAKVPSRYSSAAGDWVGVSARVSVLIYNPKLITASALPKKAIDLAAPRYSGKVAFAPSETDFQPIVTSMLRSYGQQKTTSWLDGLKSNAGSHIYPDNETVTAQVNRGQVAFGVIDQYYWYRLGAEIGTKSLHSKIAYFGSGDPGYVIDVSGAGILKSSKHQAAAAKFLAFLVSPTAQKIIGDPSKSISFEYPIAGGITTKAPETPLAKLHPYPITVGELGTGSQAVALLRQVQLL